jgi:purine-nucleoside/S-methyl-5'-thioadenosine phosphorylase / adenosine deaminase
MNSQPNDGFEWVQAAGGPALVCVPLRPFADHLFTTRDWALGSPAGGADADWQPVAASLGVDAAHLVRLHQVHGAAVVVRRAGDGRPVQPRPDADIVVSDDASVALAIQTADCVPLLIADRATGVVAAAHAGWRGLAAGVPGVTALTLAHEFGSAPANLIAAVGPSISAERYEVGEDVRERFLASGWPAARLERWFRAATRPGHWLFDGWASARDQLLSAGVHGDSIHSAAFCTSANPDLFCSYRRDGRGAGRIAAAIRRTTPG